MRAVADGRLELTDDVRRHLDLCLDCRGCESACPSGVRYSRLIEPFRLGVSASQGGARRASALQRRLIHEVFPEPRRLRRWLVPARLAQRFWVDRLLVATGLWRLLPRVLGQMLTLLPRLERSPPPLPHILRAKGDRRACVALFTGCVADVLFRRTHWATARVLQENGCDVFVLRSQVCCGAIHYHSGDEERARERADANTRVFNANPVDAVIVNVAGCGAMLKDYGHLWPDDMQAERVRLATKVKDIHEFLDQLGIIPPPGEIDLTVTYHDACHLAHAQQLRESPRRLLNKIPGLKLVELAEADLCCGAAGTYNLTQPVMANRLGRRKLENILRTGATVLATANAGCMLQIARHARFGRRKLTIVHPIELLDASYRRARFRP
jgi:glycolate oxidase iron-sulfur subunit